MHHIENTEHTSAVIVVVILILKKIIVITAVTKWTEVQTMNAKKCDRCGQLYEENEIDIRNPFRYKITKDCHPYPDEIEIDLCDKCREDFIRWLKGR